MNKPSTVKLRKAAYTLYEHPQFNYQINMYFRITQNPFLSEKRILAEFTSRFICAYNEVYEEIPEKAGMKNLPEYLEYMKKVLDRTLIYDFEVQEEAR